MCEGLLEFWWGTGNTFDSFFFFLFLEMDTPKNRQSRQTQKFLNPPTARREMLSQIALVHFHCIPLATSAL
jgi:hypothetical protein